MLLQRDRSEGAGVIGRDREYILIFHPSRSDRQIERPTIAVIVLDLHKDGQSRERILPTTATPPYPSGLTIAASPKLIWMPSAALMFGKCVISTVLVPVSGTVAIISFIFSTRCGHGGGTGAPAIGTNDSISSASDGSTRPNASRPVSRARHRPLPSTLPTGMSAFRNAAPMARA